MKSILTSSILLCFTLTHVSAQCLLQAPNGLKAKGMESCQFQLNWKKVSGAIDYTLQYKKSGTANWIVINNTGNVDSYSLTALEAGTAYEVKIAGVCSSLQTGSYSNTITATTLICSEPISLAAGELTSTSATISWSAVCNATKFSVRYRKAGVTEWATIKSIKATSFILDGLNPGTVYEVKAESKCPNGDSDYSPSIFFTTLSAKTGKNILLVIVDDARYDTYSANGGPSFFSDENISGIAQEGANFTQAFAVLSMCAPSRGSIMTGLYPHLHGITDNPPNNVNQTISGITFPEILQDNGYQTGMIGKYHISSLPQPGFDYWMEGHSNIHINASFNVNGITQTLPGHITDVVTDSALAFIQRVPQGKPFFLWLGYRAPHSPPVPRAQEEGIFDNTEMPFPENFNKFDDDYPQFNYKCHLVDDTATVDDYYRGYYELLQGVENRLGDVLDALTEDGLLDSTLVIFMSDNGFMLGEHLLIKKQLAYEESIRIPLFLRYPPQIPAGTIISDQMALNIDIAPTLLDLAGIEDTFGFQGVSLLKMINEEASRQQMLYQFINKECVPDLRCVRTHDYKFVTYNCSESTEELFDLVNDPQENLNLINDPAYSNVAEEYRNRMTFLRNYYQDYSWDSIYQCSLTNVERLQGNEMQLSALLNSFPNPAAGEMMLHFQSAEGRSGNLQIMNAYGMVVVAQTMIEPFDSFLMPIDVSRLPQGNYFVMLTHGDNQFTHSFVVQR